jgi:hypothetical protein
MLAFMCFSPSIATARDGVSEENRVVDDVVAAFDALTDRGEWLGFYMGDAPNTVPPPTTEHFQGIARSPRVDIRPIFYATRSGNIDNSEYYGSLVVVKLSCSKKDGERLGSNRLVKDHETWDTPPCAGDKVIKNIPFPDYEHLGGIQMVGDILAVPLEKPKEGKGLHEGMVVFFDCSNPSDPQRLSYEHYFDHSVGVLGITKLPGGHFFMVVSWGDGEKVEFYKSNVTSFFEPIKFDKWGSVGKTALQDLVDEGYWSFGSKTKMTTTPQSLNFVINEDDKVYLIGSSNDMTTAPFINGDDHMFLWQVKGWRKDSQNLQLVGLRGEVHKILRSEGCSINHCREANFNAGGGVYVSPTGELLYYGISHYSNGPEDTVNMAELRHKQVSHTRTCGPQFRHNHLGGPYDIDEGSNLTLDGEVYFIKPWLQMFDDVNFKGASVMMDWCTQDDDDYDDFKKLDGCATPQPDGFNDQLSSFRFCGPKGSKLRLYDDDSYEIGNTKYDRVSGTNEVVTVKYVGDDFNDEATSARIDWERPDKPYYSWDLDNDGEFDDAYGPTATFHAGCGSSTNMVRMKYTYSTITMRETKPPFSSYLKDVYEIKEATINVHNVAPTVTAEGETINENGVATVSGTITDHSTQDTFTAVIERLFNILWNHH